jgi:hypothetical protein
MFYMHSFISSTICVMSQKSMSLHLISLLSRLKKCLAFAWVTIHPGDDLDL